MGFVFPEADEAVERTLRVARERGHSPSLA